MTRRDLLTWIVSVSIVLLAQRLTSNQGWGEDVWLAVILASVAVVFAGAVRRKRSSQKKS
jgi:hypothetical protein